MLSCHPNTTHLGMRQKDLDLLDAASEGDLHKAKRALQKNADIATKGSKEGNDAAYTPLHYACEKGHEQMAAYLLKNKAPINAVTSMGRTPLHCACMAGHLGIVKLLKEHGAVMRQQDNLGGMSMHYAAAAGCLAIMQYLETLGLSTNTKDKNNATPLHSAAGQGHLPVVEYLYERGVNLGQQSHSGMTALHYAVLRKQEKVVRFLTSTADIRSFINLQTDKGSTALLFAVSQRDAESVHALVAAGASTTIQNCQGATPLAIAYVEGPPNLVMLLEEPSHSAETAPTSRKRRNPMRTCREDAARKKR